MDGNTLSIGLLVVHVLLFSFVGYALFQLRKTIRDEEDANAKTSTGTGETPH